MLRTLTVAACLCGTASDVTGAPAWTPSRGSFARYGLISETCDSDGDTSICLALACRAGRIDLVSAAGGGGPMEGPTTIRFGGRSIRVMFVDDARAIDVLGIAAARAKIPPDRIEAIAAADNVALEAPNAGVMVVHRFGTRGLAAELRRAAVLCQGRRGERRG